MTCLQELVRVVAEALLRDPRMHPRRGDVLDDDPPLVPLTVVAVWPNEEHPAVVVGERREWWHAQMIVRGRWKGSLAQWRREMDGAGIQPGRAMASVQAGMGERI